jgi:hypothetical protein
MLMSRRAGSEHARPFKPLTRNDPTSGQLLSVLAERGLELLVVRVGKGGEQLPDPKSVSGALLCVSGAPVLRSRARTRASCLGRRSNRPAIGIE